MNTPSGRDLVQMERTDRRRLRRKRVMSARQQRRRIRSYLRANRASS